MLHFSQVKQIEKRKEADALVVPLWQEKDDKLYATELSEEMKNALDIFFNAPDFSGKKGEVAYFYNAQELPEKRIIFLGLGKREKTSIEKLRCAYGALVKSAHKKKLKTLNILPPQIESLEHEKIIQGVTEGLLSANYLFEPYKFKESLQPKQLNNLEKVTWLDSTPSTLAISKESVAIFKGVYAARDLVNSNADEITPLYLADFAKKLEKQYPKISVEVFDRKKIEKAKLYLLMAVSRGASCDPTFSIATYKGNPASKDHTILIGKGVTYDTGGLNLKPTGHLETMKCDMGGAAACLCTLIPLAELDLKVNVTVVIPSTENSIDANSFKPGDVYLSYAGKTVEMTNSDAEGRLILADALAYAADHLQPTRIIDIATLTGAIEVALGSAASGLMCTDDYLASALKEAGEKTHERLWEMPLYKEYRDKLKSDIADLKSWNGRSASSSVAAMFLKQFVPSNIPWAHLDIAGTAFLSESTSYLPKYGTGVGVRLFIEYFKSLQIEAFEE